MADAKSQVMTDWLANTIVGAHARGEVKRAACTIALTTAHDAGDVLELLPLPSNARMDRLILRSGGSTSGAANIGLYRYDKFGTRSVVDADLFASAQALGSALADVNVLHESGVFGIDELGKALWEFDSGVTEDPCDYYVIGAAVTTDIGAADLLGVFAEYVI